MTLTGAVGWQTHKAVQVFAALHILPTGDPEHLSDYVDHERESSRVIANAINGNVHHLLPFRIRFDQIRHSGGLLFTQSMITRLDLVLFALLGFIVINCGVPEAFAVAQALGIPTSHPLIRTATNYTSRRRRHFYVAFEHGSLPFERAEFLGDAVAGVACAIVHYNDAIARNQNPLLSGPVSLAVNREVARGPLAAYAGALGFGNLFPWYGEKSMCDTAEALFGGVFMDMDEDWVAFVGWLREELGWP
ncbi:hypothetical protein HDV00_005700 [Rhizophlyctis rosea]|nr:hypothetical protein HDV00_005700 [Rhizophlyctis rosea]